jgi:hypothetical protein
MNWGAELFKILLEFFGLVLGGSLLLSAVTVLGIYGALCYTDSRKEKKSK